MNATMTCNTATFNPQGQLCVPAIHDSNAAARHPIRARRTYLIASLGRFFRALMKTNDEMLYGLPTTMRGRLYL